MKYCDVSWVCGLRNAAMVALCSVMLAACAPAPEDKEAGVLQDPFETVNRGIFSFNEVVDNVVLEPVARAYRFLVPEYGRQRVSNVLSNLTMPVVFINSVLQGDPGNAFSSLFSFVLNSTFGVAGIFDFVGANTDLQVHKEDFGQTLGVWGFGSGAYIMLPILGPSSARDTVGLVADWFTDPFNYADNEVVITRTVLRTIDARADTLDLTDEVYRTSLDPYATFRSGYLQKRDAMVKNTHSQDTE